MNLDQNLQTLMDEAPQYGIPLEVMKKAIIPVLQEFANSLEYQQYYILQNPDGKWVVTTLSYRKNSQLEKKVIYAFCSDTDAINFPSQPDLKAKAIAIATTHLLFQLFPLEEVSSIIFMEQPGNLDQGKEVSGQAIRSAIAQKIQQLRVNPRNIPSNFA